MFIPAFERAMPDHFQSEHRSTQNQIPPDWSAWDILNHRNTAQFRETFPNRCDQIRMNHIPTQGTQ